MQFTVIGAAANEAARLAGMCKDQKRWVLVSSAFPRCFPGQMISLGHHVMRGIDTPEEIFTLVEYDDLSSIEYRAQRMAEAGQPAPDGT